ncbi:MAG: DUF433 domain-containing protein [Deltaproteobacteria bacterium]|nr:DUF433 domain-containing protein [Deltaproteobacteria bacterium]MBW2339206.1 DUF433 domain-containing protein [Deltaproteobacteria bacterium]
MPNIIDKKIIHGKRIIKGTRIPVSIVVGSLARGMTYEKVCEEYGITREDILDSLQYAAGLTASKEVRNPARQ